MRLSVLLLLLFPFAVYAQETRVRVANGSDVATGTTADAAVSGDTSGTVSAKLRQLNKVITLSWDSGNNRINVAIQNTPAVTQSGTWTVQPGNTANTTPWLFTISQGGNSATVSAGGALKVDNSAVTQPVSGTFWQATQPVSGTFWQATQPISGTVTANAGTNLNTSALALDATQTNRTAKAQVTDGTRDGTVKAASTLPLLTDTALVTTQRDPLPAGTNVIGHTINDTGSTTAVTGNVTVVQATNANLKADVTSNAANISTETTAAKLTQTQGSTTSGQSGPLIQGAVTTAAPTYTTAQTSPLSLSTTGSLRTTCDNCGGSTFADNGAFTFGTSSVVNTGAVVDDVSTNTVAENSSGTPRMSGSRVLYVDLSKTTANATAIKVDNSAVTQPISAASLPLPTGAATSAIQTTQQTSLTNIEGSTSGTDVNTANILALSSTIDTSLNTIKSTVVTQGTTASTKIQVVGGKSNDGTPQYKEIPLGAGARSVIVEGVAGGTALPVSGTFWQATQPVSGTVTTTPPANASTNLAQVAGTTTDTNSGTKSAGTLRVVLATDQPALTNKLLVTPDSVALPANQSVNVNQIAGSAIATAATGSQKVGVTGNAGAAFDAANNAAAPANVVVDGFETATQTSTQPTAATAGNVRRGLARTDGVLYVAPHGPVIWSCGLTGIGTTLTQCQAAPAAGLRLYITDVVSQSNTATAGLFTIRFGTGANCVTGTGNVFFASASALMASPANTVAVNHFHLTTPIAITAANAICVLGVVTNTTAIQINGYTAP